MDTLKKRGVVIQGFDILDVTKFIGKMNKKYQAILLSKLEEILPRDDNFLDVRKIVLDSFNDYTRDVIESIFGNIEDDVSNTKR